MSVRTVSSVDDLTGLSISIVEYLSEWADTEYRTVGCFDSVTTLLESGDDTRVLRFLDTVTTRLQHADVSVFFTVNPAAHDEQTLAKLTSLFETGSGFENDDCDDDR